MLCDNLMDIFINGTLVSFEKKDTQHIDITPYLTIGKNILMIRAYQTDSPYRFTSAITGGLHMEYADGTVQEILTDDKFENVRFVDFWETKEPDGWEVEWEKNKEVLNQLLVTATHPISIKRSCLFRRDFNISKPIFSAVLYCSALYALHRSKGISVARRNALRRLAWHGY